MNFHEKLKSLTYLLRCLKSGAEETPCFEALKVEQSLSQWVQKELRKTCADIFSEWESRASSLLRTSLKNAKSCVLLDNHIHNCKRNHILFFKCTINFSTDSFKGIMYIRPSQNIVLKWPKSFSLTIATLQ